MAEETPGPAQDVQDDEANSLFYEMDINGDGGVSIIEWMAAFQKLDAAGNGSITREVWERHKGEPAVFNIIAGSSSSVNKREWINAYTRIDGKRSGAITLKDWQKAMGATGQKPRLGKKRSLRHALLNMLTSEEAEAASKGENVASRKSRASDEAGMEEQVSTEQRVQQIMQECNAHSHSRCEGLGDMDSSSDEEFTFEDSEKSDSEEWSGDGTGTMPPWSRTVSPGATRRFTTRRTQYCISEKSENVAVEQWSLSKWLSSLCCPQSGTIADVIATQLSKNFDEGGQLAFLKTVGKENSIDLTMALLSTVGVLEGISGLLLHGAKQLVAEMPGQGGDQLHPKFLQEPNALRPFMATRSLEAFVDLPQPDVLKAMFREHCAEVDSDETWITSHYQLTTAPSIEWAFVFDPEGGPEACKEAVATDSLDAKLAAWRRSLKAGSMDVRGEQATAYLTYSQFQERARERRSALREQQAADPTGAWQNWEWPKEKRLGKVEHCRCPRSMADFAEELRRVNKLLTQAGQPPMLVEELIGARLHTGPMSEKYNLALQRHTKVFSMDTRFRELCKGNKYGTTIHVITSALSKLRWILPVSTVYRGLRSSLLPRAVWEPNELNVRGGVEFGFVSATSDRARAMARAGEDAEEEGAGTVFEIRAAGVNNGADLEWLSQYPHEGEICFGPLTGIEILRTRVHVAVLVVEVSLIAAPAAAYIDDIMARRLPLVRSFVRHLQQEESHFLAEWKAEDMLLKVREITDRSLDENSSDLFKELTTCKPDVFKDNAKFAAALEELLEANTWLLGARALETPLEIMALLRASSGKCPQGHDLKVQKASGLQPQCNTCGQTFVRGSRFNACKRGHVHMVCRSCAVNSFFEPRQPKTSTGFWSNLFGSGGLVTDGTILDESLYDAVEGLKESGEPLEPIIRLLTARFLHADVHQEAVVRFVTFLALRALTPCNGASLLQCLWQDGALATLESSFPEWIISGGFYAGEKHIEEQRLGWLMKQEGISPKGFCEIVQLGEDAASVLVSIGLKEKCDEWCIGEQLAGGLRDGTDCSFCVVDQVSHSEVCAGQFAFSLHTGEAIGIFDQRAFALEWA